MYSSIEPAVGLFAVVHSRLSLLSLVWASSCHDFPTVGAS